jgi:hypothetical protein
MPRNSTSPNFSRNKPRSNQRVDCADKFSSPLVTPQIVKSALASGLDFFSLAQSFSKGTMMTQN